MVDAAMPLQMVEFAGEHGRVAMGDAIRLTGASRNTLTQHFLTIPQSVLIRADEMIR